jgi:ParB family transcriptional regulator, chromosome partitioning protein
MQTLILDIPISAIVITNPRSRNRMKWMELVASIRAVGLKRPVTVSLRPEPTLDGKRFDLVCGQGRVEAFVELGESTIPAIVTHVSREDQFLMGLVENLARRKPSNCDILREVKLLRTRGYNSEVIATKLGIDRVFIYGLVHLIERGEESLVEHVEAGRLPISVAIEIARGDDHAVSLALSEAYQSGQLRGAKLTTVRKLVAARTKQQRANNDGGDNKKQIAPGALVKAYEQTVQEQQAIATKAAKVQDRILLLCSVFRQLLQDQSFVELLRAENLAEMPEKLSQRLG